VRQSIYVTREALSHLFFQRCFYLCVLLLALIVMAPYMDTLPRGILLRNILNIFVILCAVAAVGRTHSSFIVVLCLAVPALVFRVLSFVKAEGQFFDLSLRMDVALYATALALLLHYVFGKEVMTGDRLWGAAASYLMVGLLWSFLFAIIDRSVPGSFAVRGTSTSMDFTDLIYFSFSTLTTTGFGDIAPVSRSARIASVLEGIIGQLFLAILIAKLVGVYPAPAESESASP